MKKNLLVWGSALVLIVMAIFITSSYDKNKSAASSPTQTITSQPEKQPLSDNNAIDITAADKAIDFTLTDLDGRKISLGDYKGKNVYLNFFATWCPPCKAEMPDIEKMYQKYKDNDLVVLAVAVGEDRETVKNFVQKNGYSFKVLLDSDQSVGQQYEISAIPVSVFIDKNGNVVAKRVGALREAEMEQYVKMLVEKNNF
ncbi:MAG: TlpA family protein disulfide reductase [Clostridia bacterium]|nr:TlpA family protein disulfide reductase [Clostridia bacterium]